MDTLYEMLRDRIQSGRATPAEVEAYLSEMGLPSFRALGRQFARTMEPSAEEVQAANASPALEAAEAVASRIAQSGTFGLIDNAVESFDPGLADEMESTARSAREDAPAASLGLDIAMGFAAPGNLLTRGTMKTIPRIAAGMGLGAAEGGMAGYGHSPLDAAEVEKLIAGGIGATVGGATGGLATAVGAPLYAMARRTGVGSSAGSRLSAEAAQLTGEAPSPGLFSMTSASRARSSIANTNDPNGIRRALTERTNQVGDQVFGPLQDAKLVPGTKEFLNELTSNPVTGPLVRTIRGRVREGFGETAKWTFRDAQRLHRRLREMSRLKSLDPKAQADTETVRQMADQLQELLDASTGGRFSEANRAFQRAAEAEEAFNIGFGYRSVGETAVEQTAGSSSPAQMRALFEQFADNPEAQDNLRRGLLHDFMDRATASGSGHAAQALAAGGGSYGDAEMLRAMFPAGREGTRMFDQFMQEARRELATEVMSGIGGRGADVLGRATLVRGLMSPR